MKSNSNEKDDPRRDTKKHEGVSGARDHEEGEENLEVDGPGLSWSGDSDSVYWTGEE